MRFVTQMPLGLRKSGMPDSVEMPAPVKPTMRFDRAISSTASEKCILNSFLIGLWVVFAPCQALFLVLVFSRFPLVCQLFDSRLDAGWELSSYSRIHNVSAKSRLFFGRF